MTLRYAAAARRQCDLTGKVANNGYNVTFSHKRNKKLQGVNLQEKKVFWPAKQRWVTLKLSTRVRRFPNVCNEHLAVKSPALHHHRHVACRVCWNICLSWHVCNMQAIKTIEKKGLETMAKEAGLDLNSLPYR